MAGPDAAIYTGGIARRSIHRCSDTGAIPSRAAAMLVLAETLSATSRSVAFSISDKDEA